VRNPGWLLPYISVSLMSLGLLALRLPQAPGQDRRDRWARCPLGPEPHGRACRRSLG
jgi:hypothetical protein